MRPTPPSEVRYGVFVELWAAVSVSIILLLIVGLIWFGMVPGGARSIVGIVGYSDHRGGPAPEVHQLGAPRDVAARHRGRRDPASGSSGSNVILLGMVGLAVLIFADNIREVIRR
jgi:hypothetical protein